ncbi:rhomboid family intramembrane serine protease [Stieleria sp. TO1_6]|uniref:rhomboid family intramembrane serine protease n=1 Tax=Stieleria tagensis TaxID=2956795 RepID=UPI00209A7594|nr:rhomboid family intramembrane serine protease [Stieleria tagensis]MCO8123046.1 rhomboid family intramembrane serine protease [Stieleria tagensis]
MIIPYSTDAPLYHWPIVTASIIVTNIVVFCATTLQVMLGNLEPEQIEWLTFQFNQINPLQWLTGNFMHADFFHLFGNMFFLFVFGLVVEGKAGNLRFAAIYLGICILIGAVAQVPMYLMGDEGNALGASGVISGLMVIALVWAPENEMECLYFIMYPLMGTFEARIITFSCFFIALDLISLVLSGFSMSGAMGHTLGALAGFPIAIYMLRTDTVDCEGWDLISRNPWLQQYPLLYGEKQRQRDEDQTNEVENPVATALALTGGDVSASRTIGLASTPQAKKPADSRPKSRTAAAVAPKIRKRKNAPPSAAEIAEKCQAHAEFNRLAFVLRQCLQSQNLAAAQQAFLRLDSLQIAAGLSEQTLMRYAVALGQEKQWVNAIRPLAIITNARGPMADDACLRLAQIQLRILKRPDQAIATLEKISHSEGVAIDEAKRQRLHKRDQLLQSARGGSSAPS